MGALILDSRPLCTPLEPLRTPREFGPGLRTHLLSADRRGRDDLHHPASTVQAAGVQGGACRDLRRGHNASCRWVIAEGR